MVIKKLQLYVTSAELCCIVVQKFCKMNSPTPNSSGSIPVLRPIAKISPATNPVANIETGTGRRSELSCVILF